MGGETYNVLTWETTLAGIKEGRHQLSFSLEASLLVPQKRSSRSLFGGGGMFDDPMFNDPFFDSFFGGYQRRPVTVTSPPVVFNVMPLPAAGRPEAFSGAIGEFDLQVSANSRAIEVGEPLTLTMAISGQGNFDRVEAPAFPDSPDWKTYSPTATFAGDQADHATSGTKRFEQAIVARSPAVTRNPRPLLQLFRPRQERVCHQDQQSAQGNGHGERRPLRPHRQRPLPQPVRLRQGRRQLDRRPKSRPSRNSRRWPPRRLRPALPVLLPSICRPGSSSPVWSRSGRKPGSSPYAACASSCFLFF